jgi:hypothetical protein
MADEVAAGWLRDTRLLEDSGAAGGGCRAFFVFGESFAILVIGSNTEGGLIFVFTIPGTEDRVGGGRGLNGLCGLSRDWTSFPVLVLPGSARKLLPR